jgi:hypothetical protein
MKRGLSCRLNSRFRMGLAHCWNGRRDSLPTVVLSTFRLVKNFSALAAMLLDSLPTKE